MKKTTNKKTFLVIIILFAIVVGAVALTNSGRIAVWSAPKKQAATKRSEAAQKADELFWHTFHQGAYDKIQPALEALTAAYLKTPADAVTAAHIAWLIQRLRVMTLRSIKLGMNPQRTLILPRFFKHGEIKKSFPRRIIK